MCAFFSVLILPVGSLGGRGPFVTFTFDDFHRSALTIGGAILEECGGRGTYYTAMGLLGGHDDYGEYFRSSDLRSLVDRGHELANHTYSHVAAGDVSLKNFSDRNRAMRRCSAGGPEEWCLKQLCLPLWQCDLDGKTKSR